MQSVIQYNIKRAGKKDVRQWLEVTARDIPVREGGKKKIQKMTRIPQVLRQVSPGGISLLCNPPFGNSKFNRKNALSNLSSFHAGPALLVGQDQMASKGLFKPEFSKIP